MKKKNKENFKNRLNNYIRSLKLKKKNLNKDNKIK